MSDLVEALDLDASVGEERIFELADEFGRAALKGFLKRFDTPQPRVMIDGEEHYWIGRKPKTYCSTRGEVTVERNVYRPRGVHNGSQACPLELRAGMVGGKWTPNCADDMAFLAARVPEREAAEIGGRVGSLSYSAPSFQRVTRWLGERWEADRDIYETAVVDAEEIPEEATSVSVAIDRVSLLMNEDDDLNWRMAYCGCVTIYDASGDPLKTWRYGRLHGDAHIVREQMVWDVETLLTKRPDLVLIALSDGAPEMCSILSTDYPDAPRLVDFYHVIEKLSAAARAYFEDAEKASKVVSRWKLRLLNDDEAIDQIGWQIASWNAAHIRVGDTTPVHNALTYIANHREQMRYASLRERGLPIGSGAVESTCKQLVAMRMKRSGQRWKRRGGQAILSLRSLCLSDRWDAAMKLVLKTYQAEVTPVPKAA
jgi:hypothetical protein